MHLQAYVYIIFVFRVVYVEMSTRSSQINHLNLEFLCLAVVVVVVVAVVVVVVVATAAAAAAVFSYEN